MYKILTEFIFAIFCAFILHSGLELLRSIGIGTIFLPFLVKINLYFFISIIFNNFLKQKYKTYTLVFFIVLVGFEIYSYYDNPYLLLSQVYFYATFFIFSIYLGFQVKSRWLVGIGCFLMLWILPILLMNVIYPEQYFDKNISYSIKIHSLQFPSFSLPTMDSSFFTNKNLENRITVAVFANKYDRVCASVLAKIRYTYHRDTCPEFQLIMVDVGYKHSWENTLNYYATDNDPMDCEGRVFFPNSVNNFNIIVAHDKDASLTKSMEIRGLPKILLFDRQGKLVYELDFISNRETINEVSKVLEKEIRNRLE